MMTIALRAAALALLFTSPVLAASQAAFRVGAVVVSSARVSAQVGTSAPRDGIRLSMAARGPSSAAVQVGDRPAIHAPAAGELTLPSPAAGDVVVTLLY